MTLSLLIKATALLVVVLIAVRAAQRARASVRHAMLAATFVALATLPLATAWLPAWELPVLPPSAVRAVSQGINHDRSGVRAGSGMARPIEGAEPRVTAGPARSVGNSAVEWIVLATWLAGAVGVLLTLAVSMLRLQRLRRAALPCLETQRHLRALARSAGIGRPVDLVVHEDVGAPITYGILRPAIVLPPDAQHWPDAAMTRALVHELEHVKRRDWAVQMIARVVCALYWFHPLVWMAYRQLCLQAEHACDDAVVMREEETGYADQLVTLARRLAARPSVAVIGMAQRSDLAARVSAVLDASRPRGRAGAARAGAIAATALALLLALAPLQLVAMGDESGPADGGAERAANLAAAGAEPLEEAQREEAQRRSRASRLDRVLVEAADAGDLHDVRELLDDGANVNAAVLGDGSPLIAAAREGHRDIVQLLIEGGADVNLGVPGDGAPLIMAAREGHLAIVELLLDRGANVDAVVEGDENALIQASGAGQFAVVKLLVARGANVNARVWIDPGPGRPAGAWRTPLGMASNNGHRDLAAFLRASGAME